MAETFLLVENLAGVEKYVIKTLGKAVKRYKYQALDLDIQMAILHRLHICKMDIQSACRGNPLTPYEMHVTNCRTG